MKIDSVAASSALQLPVYRQIYQRYRDSIAAGHLLPGDRVASVRALAAELNLARGTVEAAYQMLIAEGYLLPRGPAGTVVSPHLSALPSAGEPPAAAPPLEPLLHNGERPLPLQMGLPALDAFPRKAWTRLAGRALRESGLDGLVYPDARGHGALRSAIAGYLGVSRGIACSASQVFICAGYQACLDLICRSLMRQGDECWFEDPGYFQARRFLHSAGARLVPVPVDAHGLDVDQGLERAPQARFAVVTPTHQSPLGVTLSLPRRQQLLRWAAQQQSWIIEDDYDSEYRYHGRPIPALKSLDNHGRVLYTGTFSKVLTPGIRLAYLVVPQELVGLFTRMIDTAQNHCPQLWQATAATFIDTGHFAKHLRKMRVLYAQRRAWLVEALHATLAGQLQVDIQAGGMHVVGRLAEGIDDRQVAYSARLIGLAVQPLSAWYLAAPPQRALLMGFTNVRDASEAQHLAQRLGEICRDRHVFPAAFASQPAPAGRS
ncbi:PLP-dependent aminotransferase family protein [Pseudomonas sp. v388]|uniref:MocR-like pyridoxine biosynthesis transcription factor PdxR n=1 Tax=Pseudomonas sp. v388 TaxID=2479849 RepID=UPI000F78A3D9|nr:PLP-dependent aminotransferase family protein [Pseudomonas sp. v388]RRV10698.1 PLP-dependent aminotransferase family protein [Pseudomonas sp. v388]